MLTLTHIYSAAFESGTGNVQQTRCVFTVTLKRWLAKWGSKFVRTLLSNIDKDQCLNRIYILWEQNTHAESVCVCVFAHWLVVHISMCDWLRCFLFRGSLGVLSHGLVGIVFCCYRKNPSILRTAVETQTQLAESAERERSQLEQSQDRAGSSHVFL